MNDIEALRAEVERLQAELDNRWATGVHTCHDKCQRIACVLRRDNKRLAEALRDLLDDAVRRGMPGDDHSVTEAQVALRDHDQENQRE